MKFYRLRKDEIFAESDPRKNRKVKRESFFGRQADDTVASPSPATIDRAMTRCT
jgi:hypothetical protein